MTVNRQPEASLSHLPRADGSATYSYGGYAVTASANGPMEAGRRDEDPDKAIVDVVVRPAAGVGGTRERHLESILRSTLQQVILANKFPRCVIQIVLQVKTTPQNDYVNSKLVQPNVDLSIIPALFQAAILALLSAAVPMKVTATCTSIAVLPGRDGKLVVDPLPADLDKARSFHVLAFTSGEDLLLAESEGDFSVAEWESVCSAARGVCCKPAGDDASAMAVDGEDKRDGPDLQRFVSSTVQAKLATDFQWKK